MYYLSMLGSKLIHDYKDGPCCFGLMINKKFDKHLAIALGVLTIVQHLFVI